jgi:hypothetical protein
MILEHKNVPSKLRMTHSISNRSHLGFPSKRAMLDAQSRTYCIIFAAIKIILIKSMISLMFELNNFNDLIRVNWKL